MSILETIYCRNEEEFKDLQLALFSKGYNWYNSGKRVLNYRDISKKDPYFNFKIHILYIDLIYNKLHKYNKFLLYGFRKKDSVKNFNASSYVIRNSVTVNIDNIFSIEDIVDSL